MNPQCCQPAYCKQNAPENYSGAVLCGDCYRGCTHCGSNVFVRYTSEGYVAECGGKCDGVGLMSFIADTQEDALRGWEFYGNSAGGSVTSKKA